MDGGGGGGGGGGGNTLDAKSFYLWMSLACIINIILFGVFLQSEETPQTYAYDMLTL